MAFCNLCPEEEQDQPWVVNGQPFCANGHPLYRLSAPAEVAGDVRPQQGGRLDVRVVNTGGWEVSVRSVLHGALSRRGARVLPTDPAPCAVGEAQIFTIELPPGSLTTDTLEGELELRLEAKQAQQAAIQNSLPRVKVRFEVARPQLLVEPDSLEFVWEQGPRSLKIRNVGREGCTVRVDDKQSSPELAVTSAALAAEPSSAPTDLPVEVQWKRLPQGETEYKLTLVLRAEGDVCPPVSVPVRVLGQNSGAIQAAIGLDFGTSKSVVATIPPDSFSPRLLRIQGAELSPTVVAIKRTDPQTRYWGKTATGLKTNTYALIRSVKTALGEDITYDVDRWDATRGEFQRAAEFTPEEIASYFLSGLLAETRRELSQLYGGAPVEIGTVVLTMPANWKQSERAATFRAFQAAGIATQRLVTFNEARAAAIAAFELHAHRPEMTLLVYDMGAGTLDATLVRKSPDARGEPSYTEDGAPSGEKEDCAGDYFDRKVAEEFIHQLNSQFETRLEYSALVGSALQSEERELAEQVLMAARDAKERLSNSAGGFVQSEAEVQLPGRGKQRVKLLLEQVKFEGWIGARVEAVTKKVLDGVFEGARTVKQREQVDLVLLVGGSVHVPLVRRMVEAYFQGSGVKVEKYRRAEFAVGLGAARMAEQLGGLGSTEVEAEGIQQGDRISYSIGFVGRGQRFVPLVLAGGECGTSYSSERELHGHGMINLKLVQYVGAVKDPTKHEALYVLDENEWAILASKPMALPARRGQTTLKALLDVDIDSGGRVKASVRWATPDGRKTGDAVELVSRPE